jgi:N-acetyl-anhydromuramyl-L-alanine amidase AmpD
MGGSLAGTDAVFGETSSGVSAHYAVGLDGQVRQYVSLADSAFANGILEPGNRWAQVCTGACDPKTNPNFLTVAIQTEDRGSATEPVNDAQFNAVKEVCDIALGLFPSIRWLLQHADISPTSRAGCPGPRWIASGRFAALADVLNLQTTQ